MFRSLLPVALVLLPLASARADVLVVATTGPADFTSLQAAANAASDGDILLVRSYVENFSTPETVLPDKSLTIVGDTIGTHTVARLQLPGLSAGRTLVLQNLKFSGGLKLMNAAGSVRVEACDSTGLAGSTGFWMQGILPVPGTPGILISDCADVVLARCTATGGAGAILWEDDYEWAASDGGPGVRAVSSLVTLLSSDCRGGHGGFADSGGDSGADGGSGVVNEHATILLHAGTMHGGHGGGGDFSGFGCGYGGEGGDGLYAYGGASLTYLRSVYLLGGAGGSAGCSSAGDGTDGQPVAYDGVENAVHLSGAQTRFAVDSPVREQGVVNITVTAEPGDGVWTWLGLGATHAILPKFQGSLLVEPAFATLVLGVAGVDGKLSVQGKLPELGPGIEGVTLPMQCFVDHAGSWLLGPLTILVGLDDSF